MVTTEGQGCQHSHTQICSLLPPSAFYHHLQQTIFSWKFHLLLWINKSFLNILQDDDSLVCLLLLYFCLFDCLHFFTLNLSNMCVMHSHSMHTMHLSKLVLFLWSKLLQGHCHRWLYNTYGKTKVYCCMCDTVSSVTTMSMLTVQQSPAPGQGSSWVAELPWSPAAQTNNNYNFGQLSSLMFQCL